jgi:hypothetical protein
MMQASDDASFNDALGRQVMPNPLTAMTCKTAILATLLVVLSYSCRDQAPPRVNPGGMSEATIRSADDKESTKGAEAKNAYYYSPFVVKLDGGKFNTVSFKDVGLDRETTDANDPLFEMIAASFAYEISQSEALGYDAQVTYDEKILDPENHLYCGIDHLYIDVWRSTSPDRWGFSLWSGCGEIDNFAWKEVPDTSPSADPTVRVEALTSGIIEALAAAAESNCFQKTC